MDGEIVFDNGIKTVHFSTAYGDGFYEDQNGNLYAVDAGLIGCIRIKDITDKQADLTCGNVVNFDYDFECESNDGVLCFGNIVIDTKNEFNEENEDEQFEEEIIT